MSTVPASAMIMAAGLGTRMRPLTDSRPKPLIEVAGKPLLEFALEQLEAAGVSHAVVNVHYLADQVEDFLARRKGTITIAVSDERDLLLETGGGLVKAEPLIVGDPFFALNSDNVWTNAGGDTLVALAKQWDDERMDALLLLVPRASARNHGGAGDFFLDSAGRIERRGERDEAPYIYTGIQICSKRLLRDAPSGPFSTNVLWDRAIAEGRCFGAIYSGLWFDVGTPQAIASTEEELVDG